MAHVNLSLRPACVVSHALTPRDARNAPLGLSGRGRARLCPDWNQQRPKLRYLKLKVRAEASRAAEMSSHDDPNMALALVAYGLPGDDVSTSVYGICSRYLEGPGWENEQSRKKTSLLLTSLMDPVVRQVLFDETEAADGQNPDTLLDELYQRVFHTGSGDNSGSKASKVGRVLTDLAGILTHDRDDAINSFTTFILLKGRVRDTASEEMEKARHDVMSRSTKVLRMEAAQHAKQAAEEGGEIEKLESAAESLPGLKDIFPQDLLQSKTMRWSIQTLMWHYCETTFSAGTEQPSLEKFWDEYCPRQLGFRMRWSEMDPDTARNILDMYCRAFSSSTLMGWDKFGGIQMPRSQPPGE